MRYDASGADNAQAATYLVTTRLVDASSRGGVVATGGPGGCCLVGSEIFAR